MGDLLIYHAPEPVHSDEHPQLAVTEYQLSRSAMYFSSLTVS